MYLLLFWPLLFYLFTIPGILRGRRGLVPFQLGFCSEIKVRVYLAGIPLILRLFRCNSFFWCFGSLYGFDLHVLIRFDGALLSCRWLFVMNRALYDLMLLSLSSYDFGTILMFCCWISHQKPSLGNTSK